MSDLRYPVGKFEWTQPESEQQSAKDRVRYIEVLAKLPAQMRAAVQGLSPEQLDTPYRQGGWTVRQVIHHVPDSHMNSYMRFRLALTEDEPSVKGYAEDKWAELYDARTAPVDASLQLLENLHSRWVVLLKAMSGAEFSRTFRHPELGLVRLDTNMALYAWHGRHHAAHITGLRERNGW